MVNRWRIAADALAAYSRREGFTIDSVGLEFVTTVAGKAAIFAEALFLIQVAAQIHDEVIFQTAGKIIQAWQRWLQGLEVRFFSLQGKGE